MALEQGVSGLVELGSGATSLVIRFIGEVAGQGHFFFWVFIFFFLHRRQGYQRKQHQSSK
jgi:hypothetical protein